MPRDPIATTARLSFWVHPEWLDNFSIFYKEQLAPILTKHGLVESVERSRVTVAGIFSRFFELESPVAIIEKEKALQNDPIWQGALRSWTTTTGTIDASLRCHLEPYQALAGQGKFVLAGQGAGHWRTYDATDGLIGGVVFSISQDRKGQLWFGTGRGASCYDGSGFKTFTAQDGLIDNEVFEIVQDNNGGLWFGTASGVYCYDGKAFTPFTTEEHSIAPKVFAVFQDSRGWLWFGTAKGAHRYDGKAFKTFTTQDGLAHNMARPIVQDREGYLWFGTNGGGVSRYDGKAFKTFTTQDGLAHNIVRSIVQDREGNLWFGTTGGGVSCYDGTTFTTYTTKEGLANNWVRVIFLDQEGYLWFGTSGGGVSCYDGTTFTTYTTKEGLVHNQVSAIYQDQEGYLWFGSHGGACRYDRQTITSFTPQNGLVDNVYSIFQDREDRLWFGSVGQGACCYDGQVFTIYTTQDGLAHNNVWPITQDREGHLWFGTMGGGASRFDGESFTTFTTQDGLADNRVTAILQDREGYFWFCTEEKGVSRFDGQVFTNFTIHDGLASNLVWSILQDRSGNIWFGTSGGASCFDGKVFTTFTPADGLAHSIVWSIFQDRDGSLWFGTANGVSRYNGQIFTTYTAKDGLADNWVRSIFQDRKGNLWFGTSGGGVSCYDGQIFQTLTRQDGLAGNIVHSIFQDRGGSIWFGTVGGVTRYRSPVSSLLPVYIDSVVADRRYEEVTDLDVPGNVKLIAFEFHGVSIKTRPGAMVYRFFLEGYDETWRTTHTQRVEYNDLALGEYTFWVKAIDRDLNYSAPATIRLRIIPDPRLEALTQVLSGTKEDFIGESETLRQMQTQLMRVAPTELTVLILGETGTGKGLAARTLHRLSQRRAGPFIQVNCGALPEGLVESKLFGHEKGSFTGAISRKIGKVELAEGGTLFLDEIGDLSLVAQAKLLLVLEERTFVRVGGTQTLKADVRVIAATNRDLEKMITTGAFREDLYFRLQVFPIFLPPLRQRKEDLPALATYFGGRMAAHLNKKITSVTPEALFALQAYHWPGNVRELEHVMQRAVVVCTGEVIRIEVLGLGTGPGQKEIVKPVLTLEAQERRHILQVLEQTQWVIKGPGGAAEILGVPASTLYSRMRKLGIGRS